MFSLVHLRHLLQAAAGAILCAGMTASHSWTAEPAPSATAAPNVAASSEAEMKPYTEVISGTPSTFDMVPIRGGKFLMGSPPSEAGRQGDEGPQHEVEIAPFWMGKCEVTWDEYEIWSYNLDIQRRQILGKKPTELDKLADAVTRPTAPYTDMTFPHGAGALYSTTEDLLRWTQGLFGNKLLSWILPLMLSLSAT